MIQRRSLYYFLFLTVSLFYISCNDDVVVDPVDPITPPVFNIDIAEIKINTLGNDIVDEPKNRASMTITDYGIDSTEFIDYDGIIGIELRGSTSQSLFEKKSYGIELWDNNGEDISASIFGLPEEEDWILNGPYSDKSLIRNVLIYELSNDIGRYAARTRMCDLYINNEHQGMYVFMEKLKRDNARIDISKLNPEEISGEDLTGGYILKIDKATGNGSGTDTYNSFNSFASPYDVNGMRNGAIQTHFLYEYPKAEDIVTEQKAYIQRYISDFETALASNNYTDPLEGYAAYIDVESFIDFFILNEFAHNPDAYRLSTYMYKDKNEKLHMGPIWDFNIAFGNSDFCVGGEPDTWVFEYNDTCPNDAWLVTFWWKRLLSDSNFSDRLKARYAELRMTTLSIPNVYSKIDKHSQLLEDTGSSYRNFNQWDILGDYVWPNRFVGDTYTEEVDYLKDWIQQRVDWMDANIDDL
jgi:spore coat protein CotH